MEIKMKKRLVLAGAGHAHLEILTHLSAFVKNEIAVFVISPDEHHYYSGMGPGLLSGIYSVQEARFNIKKMTESAGGIFIKAYVKDIDADNKCVYLSNGSSIDYGILSINTGSAAGANLSKIQQPNVFPVKPVQNLYNARGKIIEHARKGKINVVVAGGGPAGVEIAAALSRLAHDCENEILVYLVTGGRLLKNFPKKFSSMAKDSLSNNGINIINSRIVSISNGVLSVGNGQSLDFDFLLNATGITPSLPEVKSGLSTENDGSLFVNEFLQAVNHPDVFAGGDCISFCPMKLDHVGVYAVRQGPVLLQNIQAVFSSRQLKKFHPRKTYLQILNMGDDTGLLKMGKIVMNGILPFKIKNMIDLRFMKKYQISGELNED